MSTPEPGMKHFSEMTIVERMRANLKSKGTAPIVRLRPRDSSGIWVNEDFVAKCIDELEKMPLLASLGDMPSNLEKLAYMLLCDSAYIDIEAERKHENRLTEL